jgi:hypothetical protein
MISLSPLLLIRRQESAEYELRKNEFWQYAIEVLIRLTCAPLHYTRRVEYEPPHRNEKYHIEDKNSPPDCRFRGNNSIHSIFGNQDDSRNEIHHEELVPVNHF